LKQAELTVSKSKGKVSTGKWEITKTAKENVGRTRSGRANW